MTLPLTLNERAQLVVDQMITHAVDYRITHDTVGGAHILHCATGGLQAGLQLARVCMSNRAEISLVTTDLGPSIQVVSDFPVLSCLASQYAGWQIKVDKYFAMGSGPMRAAYAKEDLFQHIHVREESSVAVGVLETRKPPTTDVVSYLVERLPQSVEKLTLAYAPAASIPGTIQVVARSLETALHKLHECKFDLSQIVSGMGVAPLPPIASQESQAIGWTNDAILYGGRVTLWVNTTDEVIAEIGPKIPSSGSADYGAPFAEIFARYGDFYKIDPLLFSPAEVTFVNLATGRQQKFGKIAPEILSKSFGI